MISKKKKKGEKNDKPESFRARLRKKLTNHFKFIIFDEAMFHEVFSLRLRPMNIVILAATAAIVLIGGTILLLRFTSLKTYVVTDDVSTLRRQTALLLSQVDELELKISQNEAYLASLRDVLSGEVNPERLQDSVFVDSISKNAKKHIWATKEDSAFRADFESRQIAAQGVETPVSRNLAVLSAPVRGAVISSPYDRAGDHPWVGLSAKANSPVFAVARGAVIYRDWTPESGNVLVISHPSGMTSVYKNVGLTQKNVGDRVVQGELIATTGLGAGATADPVLRFELWMDGTAVDPQDYVNFGM